MPTNNISEKDARGIMRGLRLRTTLRNRARRLTTRDAPTTNEQLNYLTNAFIGFAQQIVDEFDRQRAHLNNVPPKMIQSRLAQFDRTCGWERAVWIKCRRKLLDIKETNDRFPPKTQEGVDDAWRQVTHVWTTADQKADQAPKRTDTSEKLRARRQNSTKSADAR